MFKHVTWGLLTSSLVFCSSKTILQITDGTKPPAATIQQLMVLVVIKSLRPLIINMLMAAVFFTWHGKSSSDTKGMFEDAQAVQH